MAIKNNLRKQQSGAVINNTSEKREGKAALALNCVLYYDGTTVYILRRGSLCGA
jgi:hypothetical protein